MDKFSLLLFCFLVFGWAGFAQEEINWITIEEAIEAQKEHPKKILLDAYTDWCPPCKLMDKNTYGNKEVIDYINENYYAVKFNAEGQDTIHYKERTYTNPKYDPKRKGKRNYAHNFTHSLKVRAYPTTVFFDEDAEVIAPIAGYYKPTDFEVFLKMMESDDYQKIQSQEEFAEYYQNFERSFKD